MKWLVAPALLFGAMLMAPVAALAAVPPPQPPATVLPGESTTSTTVDPGSDTTIPLIVEAETGPPVPAPAALPSAPLVQIPNGCQTPPVASVVFVGRLIAKDYRVGRFQIDKIRAGDATGYVLDDLIDVRYGNEVEFLTIDDDYLVGAVPQGTDLALGSKVREAKPILGGNAVIGLTEKAAECPTIEDPVRTFHVDGTEIEAGMLDGLATRKKDIAMAFVQPVVAVFAIVLGLVLIRWLFTAIFVSVRRAAESEPVLRRRDSDRPAERLH